MHKKIWTLKKYEQLKGMSDRYKENNLEEVADSGKDSDWRSGVTLSAGQGCQAVGGGRLLCAVLVQAT